ncbi:unnamed protein product, partial [Brachionus calyciflorus]
MNKFLKYYDIFFLVLVNPDGYQFSLLEDFFWRKNLRNFSREFYDECFGVDLNRNYDYHWMKIGASNSMCTDIYAGAYPASEPEISAIQNFILSKKSHWLSFVSL